MDVTVQTQAAALREFADRLEYPAGDPSMEELYTATFDFDSSCAPYVGHHLFGEDPKRSTFLARLVEIYEKAGFEATPQGELPDHLSVVLRYLAAVPSGADREALLTDGLVPALEKMLKAVPENAYRSLLSALREEVTR